MKKMYGWISLGAVILIAAGFLIWNGKSTESEVAPAGQVIRIVNVTRGDLNLNVAADGLVQPINRVEVKSKSSGQVLTLTFEEGDYVQRGQLLALLDTTTAQNDYDQAMADIEVAKAALTQSQNNAQRARDLFEKNLISRQELDAANVDYVRAQASLVRTKAALSTMEVRLKETRIIAPASGIVLTRNIELGQIVASATSNVSGGSVLASIADMDQVYVETNVDEVDIGKVKVGQKAKVLADAFPDDTFDGEVVRIAPLGKTQQNVVTFNVIILVKNEGNKLKAGMSTSVDLVVFNRKNVLLIPNEALRDPRSEQGQEMMAAAGLSLPKEASSRPRDSKKAKEEQAPGGRVTLVEVEKFREKMRNAPAEDRDRLRGEMRAMMERLSPEDREVMAQQFRQRMQQGGGQFGGGQFGGGEGVSGRQSRGSGEAAVIGRPRGGERIKRQAQVSNENEVRWRLVMRKDSNDYRTKLVKVGASNFDNTEVLEGLNEGDAIQITSISRAKIASQEMTDRMRNANPMSGLGGSASRSASGMGGGGGRR